MLFKFWTNDNRRKMALKIVLGFFVFFEIFGMFAFVQPAKAQMDAGITAAFTSKWTWEKVGKSMMAATLGAVVNGASYFMRKLAYDAAIYSANGGKGQGALVFKQGAGAYLGSVFNDAAAETIDSFAQNALGINICQPANLKVQMNIAIGLRRLYAEQSGGAGGATGGPKPNCDWQQLKKGASSHLNALENPSQIFSKNLSVDQSDFGIALGAMARIDRTQTAALASANLARLEGQGFKAVTGLISGNVKSPATLVREETTAVTAKSQGQMSAGQIAGLYGTDALNILPMALSTFANTFVSTLLSNVMKGLFSDKPDNAGGSLSFFSSGLSQSLNPESNPFTYILTTIPKKERNVFDAVSEFASCDRSTYGINNCVINTMLQTIIEKGRSQALTISQAIKDNPDFGALPLVSPRRVADNQDAINCATHALCYSNIQKLRKARIFPLGLEIAAFNADPDHPELWTLKKVVEGFYDCPALKNGVYEADAQHPYCHLVDPNWLIKAPEIICATTVNGEQIIPGTADRQEECIDWQSCILDPGPNSRCMGHGYCTQEKNVWRFNADACTADFATCKTFSGESGLASYLARTVDYGECSIDNVGCRAYSAEMDNSKATEDKWVTSAKAQGQAYKELGRNQTLFFNEKIISQPACGSADEGCSAFYKASVDTDGNFVNNYAENNLIYLKKAPDYLNCYDTNHGTPEIDWPITRQDLNYLSDSESCNPFAQVCLPEEVGCQAYAPADNGPVVPGIVGNNFCPKLCVGYDAYKQEETKFAPAKSPMYFIPSQARACNANYAGCDEFVNIDSSVQGGEGVEYYNDLKRCEKADYPSQGVFYSWEGSANEGYVLRTHKLKTFDQIIYDQDVDNLGISDFTQQYQQDFILNIGKVKTEFATGSPAYIDTAKDKLAQNYQVCNQERYNIYLQNALERKGSSPDCRALYDKFGHVYYRLLGETVTISSACHPLRKTEPSYFVDNSIANSNSCTNVKGLWDETKSACQRCFNGGEYAEGYCFYKAITDESASCPASANGCRIYIGNTGNKIQEIFRDEFEPSNETTDAYNQAKINWSATPMTSLTIKAEALQVGMHSLQINANEAIREVVAKTLKTTNWYELSFWARGSIQNLNVKIKQLQDNGAWLEISFNSSTFSTIGDAWREYKLGPIQFTGKGSGSAEIIFSRSAVNGQALGAYYLDNVRLTELQDRVSAIRESWKTPEGYAVPLVCDADPYDPLPGQALGCQIYNDSDNQEVYLTGFDKLCREKAVGCQPMFDIYNTISEKTASYWNLWCGSTSSTCATDLGYCHDSTGATGDYCSVKTGCMGGAECRPLAECSVEKGQTGCYLEKINLPGNKSYADLGANLEVKASTIIIPADTSSTAPIYLTNYKNYRCPDKNKLGCLKVGAEEQVLPTLADSAFSHTENYLLNNPSNYEDTLCRADLVGCASYTNGNDAYFFKDPAKAGNKLCHYKPFVSNQAGDYGWFLTEDIGYCYEANGEKTSQLCKASSDCGTNQTCKDQGNVPCYENYLLSGSAGIEGRQYGIWSNGAELYNGLAGQCDAQYDRCTEFVDPADTTQNPNGQPYYLINNENKLNSADCGGKVSQKNGCVLFDQTDVPKKLFDSVATYAESDKKIKGLAGANPDAGTLGLVDTKSTANNDTNLILKVDRDRVCKEWLACKSSSYDANTKTNVCYELGRCDMTKPNLPCMDWLPANSQILTEDNYINRNITWNGEDYSGYALFNKYQVDSLSAVKIDNKDYLGYKSGETCNDDGKSCGNNNTGICVKGSCLLALSEQKIDDTKTLDNYFTSTICKAHPETTSPFAPAVVKGTAIDASKSSEDFIDTRLKLVETTARFSSANYCQNLDDCSCAYWKTTYKNGNVDYSATPVDWKGILDSSGAPCNDDSNANDDTCSRIKQKQQYLGSKGFCLEPDLSRPLPAVKGQAQKYACLTWLPLDVVGSGVDNYNNNPLTGYDPTTDANGNGQVYCTDATTPLKKPYLSQFFDDGTSVSPSSSCPVESRYLNNTNTDGDPLYFNTLMDNNSLARISYCPLTNNSDKVIYTIIQKYFWGNTFPIINNTSHPDGNMVVWDFRVTDEWFGFAKRSGLDYSGEEETANFPNTSFQNSQNLYEEDLDAVFLAPFVLPDFYNFEIADPGAVSGYYTLKSALITGKVGIDINKMRRSGSCNFGQTNYPTFNACESWDLNDVIGYDGGSDKRFKLYVFRGLITSPAAEAGKIRYMILITNFKNSHNFDTNQIIDKVNYFYSGAMPDEENQPVERIIMLIDFDGKTHKYLGVTKYSLTDGGDKWSSKIYGVDGNGKPVFRPYLAVVMQLKNSCTEFSAVTDESGSENKAWTDNVWQGAQGLTQGLGDTKNIIKGDKASPYGSTNLSASGLGDKDSQGLPLWWPGNRVDELWVGRSYNHQSQLFVNSTYSYNYAGPQISVNTDLYSLFAKVFNVVKRSGPNESGFRSTMGSDTSGKSGTFPPMIYSLNPDLCAVSGKDTEAKCQAVGEENNITVNGRNYFGTDYNDDFANADDANKDGNIDPMVGSGFYAATVNFFAWADHNKMPIRKVMVNWGDGFIQNENLVGKYANHKPYCEGAEDYPEAYECMKQNGSSNKGLTCNSSDERSCADIYNDAQMQCLPYANHFGNQAGRGACVENYFEFQHTYICKKDNIKLVNSVNVDGLDPDIKDKIRAMGYNDSVVCRFQPAVQVRDNWGWCNGDIPEGYYNDNAAKACDDMNSPKPWTYFRGEIYVIPN